MDPFSVSSLPLVMNPFYLLMKMIHNPTFTLIGLLMLNYALVSAITPPLVSTRLRLFRSLFLLLRCRLRLPGGPTINLCNSNLGPINPRLLLQREHNHILPQREPTTTWKSFSRMTMSLGPSKLPPRTILMTLLPTMTYLVFRTRNTMGTVNVERNRIVTFSTTAFGRPVPAFNADPADRNKKFNKSS